ncbi:MAG: thioredoxin family protein [Pseudomonadota bacterium]|nr:thioredoxin family protein [Pseudomonadota bacterium]
MRILLSLLGFLLPVFAGMTVFAAHAADTSQQEIVRATLVTETSAIVPGQKLNAAVLLEPKEGWHTYWENPGDAGMATHLEWGLPPGFSAGAIDWPVPERLAEGPLVTFAYPHAVLLPVTISVPASAAGNYPVRVKADWLACKDICIPESAELEVQLPVAQTATPSEHAPLFAEHEKHRLQPLRLGYAAQGKTVTLSLPYGTLGVQDIASASFFPRQENIFSYAAAQKLTAGSGQAQLALETLNPSSAPISGLLTVSSAQGKKKYYDITMTLGKAPPVTVPTNSSLPVLLLFAMLGGLILNLMPCVLPVLSLKALALVKKAGHDHPAVVKQGAAYTLGILLSFALIAGVLIGLRQAGEVIGWGYQMQSPAFVGFLTYLLFLVGLSLSGLFHLPVLMGNTPIADESSTKGSFFTGVLATAVATPCTAPFMASAVGTALTLPPAEALLIFEALGFGLALPFLLISLFPALRRFLPRPGAWMETFKELLAFPMYASVIWLLWVLTLQTGPGGMVVALSALLAILLIIRMKPLFRAGVYRAAALVAYALILGLSLPALSRMEIDPAMPAMEKTQKMGVETAEFSKEKLAELRAAGKPVFIDATAAWCITCQVNARVAIRTDRVMDAFKERGVTLMIADWTRQNAEITELLSSFGYKGVPLYVFYPAQGEPVVLPQLLTPKIVIEAITQSGSSSSP